MNVKNIKIVLYHMYNRINMVFSRFFTFVFGAVCGVYVAQNYNDVPDVRECGLYYWRRFQEVEAARRRSGGSVEDGDRCDGA